LSDDVKQRPINRQTHSSQGIKSEKCHNAASSKFIVHFAPASVSLL